MAMNTVTLGCDRLRRQSVLLLQLDGSIPNLALMRIAAYHRQRGDKIEFRAPPKSLSIQSGLWDERHDKVYASLIFDKSRPYARELLEVRPDAIIGGSGWDLHRKVEDIGITDQGLDYSLYPSWPHSIGFTQRGCRLKCSFCRVPVMEGKVKEVATVYDIWRGEPWPRHLLLLDNDFFGQENWRKRIVEIVDGGFKVCWNQGFNVRLIDDEHAEAIASTRYYDDQFKTKRLYTAWDNRRDEERLFRNLELLVRHGVDPDDIVVYMLIGYDHDTKQARPFLTEDDFYRHRRLRDFGCRPYPMPFCRPRELVRFQTWAIGAYDKRVSWEEWWSVHGRPEKLDVAREEAAMPLFAKGVNR